MSKRNTDLVEQFLQVYRQPHASGWSARWLRDDIRYELFINRPNPLNKSFRGRSAVEDYLAMVVASYQVLMAETTTLIARGNEVTVHGSELARLKLSEQLVRTEWTEVFELEAGLIKKITMTIHRWTVVPAGGRCVVKSYLLSEEESAAMLKACGP